MWDFYHMWKEYEDFDVKRNYIGGISLPPWSVLWWEWEWLGNKRTQQVCIQMCLFWTDLQGENQELNNCLMHSSMWINNSTANWAPADLFRCKPLSWWFGSVSFPCSFHLLHYYLRSHEAVLLANRQLFANGWMSTCIKPKILLHPSLKCTSVDSLKSLQLQRGYKSQVFNVESTLT